MAAFPTYDLALTFDSARLVCDVAIADGDLVLAATPVTAMLVSVFSDRRAARDDKLPAGASPLGSPDTLDERRGWVGDCLDHGNRLIGSRFWELGRDHDDDTTLIKARAFAAECMAWSGDEYGITPEIDVDWVRRGPSAALGIRIAVDGRSVSLIKKVS